VPGGGAAGHLRVPDRAGAVSRLRRSRPHGPGVHRRVQGRGFRYVDDRDDPIRDEATLGRIAGLAIPPAWTDVWICPDPEGHIQAVGVDAAGRRQYRYHDRWNERRSAEKFRRIEVFAQGLPDLRAQVAHDLSGRGLARERVLACTVRLLDATTFRIGSDTYARDNGSFGLTTIRRDHVRVGRTRAVFHYRGKGGAERTHDVRDPDALRVLRALGARRGGGRRLFVYEDDEGRLVPVRAGDVNAYLREGAGVEASAKDFRTWHATVLAAVGLAGVEEDDTRSARAVDREITEVVRGVAAVLGNTPVVCRTSYIDPRILDRFRDGSTIAADLAAVPDDVAPGRWGDAARTHIEAAVLALIAGERSRRRAA
jgi:DNA topoisomerase I